MKLYEKQIKEWQDNMKFYMASAPAYIVANPMTALYQQWQQE
jgi:hypothetical protein